MVVGLSLILALSGAVPQGDLLDGDPMVSSADYHNASIDEVLRTLFGHIRASYVIESSVSGTVNLSVRRTPFSAVLKRALSQVHASSSYQNGVFFVEDAPNLPDFEALMDRKLPKYDFSHTSVPEALTKVFENAHVKFRQPPLPADKVDKMLSPKTLRFALDNLLPLAKCRLAYRRGRFDLIAKSEELLPGGLLEKRIAALDFLDISVRDAFNSLCSQGGVQFVLGPDIDERITIKLESRTFEEVLDILCQATDTTYRWHGDVVQIDRLRFD